jgi:hypothetical protein
MPREVPNELPAESKVLPRMWGIAFRGSTPFPFTLTDGKVACPMLPVKSNSSHNHLVLHGYAVHAEEMNHHGCLEPADSFRKT